MYKAKIVTILYTLGLVLAVVCASVGLLRERPGFLVVAVWAIGLSLALLFGVIIRLFQRVMSRTSTANELLKQLKFLQERRYSQLAARMDQNDLGAESSTMINPNVGGSHPPQGASRRLLVELSELEDISARVQRAERRLLGKLEDESFEWDRRHFELRDSLSDLQEKLRSEDTRTRDE